MNLRTSSKMMKRQRSCEPMSPKPKHVRNRDSDKIGSLLSLEYFLLKVLSFLVKDGLHECRRVCHQWRDVVKKLSLKLNIHSETWLPEAIQAFPNTTKLTCAREIATADVSLRNRLRCAFFVQSPFTDTQIMEYISQFSKLEHLELNIWGNKHASRPIEAGFASLSRLRFLEFAMTDEDYAFYQFTLCLRHMTQLTHLAFGFPNRDMTGVKPLKELSKLQSLALHPDTLALPDGTLLFPNAKLRTLCIRTLHSRYHVQFPKGLLSVIHHYRQTLTELTIRPPFADLFSPQELERMAEWTQLKSFVTSGYSIRKHNFFNALQKMKSLTELDLLPIDLQMPIVKQAIFSLSNLRSLMIADMDRQHRHKLPSFTNLLQLTTLHVTGVHLGNLSCLTGLVELCLSDRTMDSTIDISDTLLSLPNLTKLRLSGSSIVVPSSSFSNLQQLRDLSLESVKIDTEIFMTLAKLPMQSLFVHFPEDFIYLYDQINLLTKLTFLGLCCDEEGHHRPFLYLREAKLSRLHYLKASGRSISVEEAEDLKRRIPTLRKIILRPI